MLAPALLLVALAAPPEAPVEVDGQVDGAFRAGFPITFTLTGPESLSETGEANPFTDYTLTGKFALAVGPGRAAPPGPYDPPGPFLVEVPGYFAADGNAANTGADAGDQWRLHYRPSGIGQLEYRLNLTRPGAGVVASAAGVIDVSAPPPSDEGADAGNGDLRPRGALAARDGRLVLVPLRTWPPFEERISLDEAALRFPTPFYKTGADSPENLLAYADFDGTHSLKSEPREGESHADAPHRYEPHLQDWTDGDPTWQGGKGKGLIGALNYLASAGVNSIYFLPHNVAGDGRDVWPYTNPDDRTRFDCSKLDQWETVFTHCDKLGIALHVILSETENESLFEHRDGPGDGPVPFADSRKLYYHELIARFAHHPALVWNLGEENGPEGEGKQDTDGRGNTNAQRSAFAAFIKKHDPYDHPIVVHTYPGKQNAVYMPLLGDPSFDGVSLQLSPMSQTREQTLAWRSRSAAAGRPWFVCLDEVGPANAGVLPDDADGAEENHRDVRRALWANLLSGGSGAEWYFGYKYHDNDLNLEDFRSRANVWRFSRIAREFAEREGLHEYEPIRDLFDADTVFAATRDRDGATLVYVPAGRKPFVPVPTADGPSAERTVRWFDVQNGGDWQTGPVKTTAGGNAVDPGAPPGRARDRDWILKIGE